MVFDLERRGNIMRMAMGEPIGTIRSLVDVFTAHPQKSVSNTTETAPPSSTFKSVKEI